VTDAESEAVAGADTTECDRDPLKVVIDVAVLVTSEEAKGDPGKDVMPVGVPGTPELDLRECAADIVVAAPEGPPVVEGLPANISLYDADPGPVVATEELVVTWSLLICCSASEAASHKGAREWKVRNRAVNGASGIRYSGYQATANHEYGCRAKMREDAKG